MDITLDYFEGLGELFDQDITEDYLAESFNTGPIKLENIFDDYNTNQFDSIVSEDLSCFLDNEINEGNNTMCKEEDLNLEKLLDGNNNANEIDKIDYMFDFDDFNPQVKDTCQIKQEDFLNLPTSVNQVPFSDNEPLFTIEHASKTVKQEQVSENDGRNKKSIGQNCKEIKNVKDIIIEVMDESSVKKKYPILPLIEADEIGLEHKKVKQSPSNTKDIKAFQFCDLCPFKTKEKSIFRMHRTLVHKLDVTKCPKKAPQKSETIRKSYQPALTKKSKVQENTRNGADDKKLISITDNEIEKNLNSGMGKFTKPSLGDSFLPRYSTTQNGYHIKLSEKTQPNSFVFKIAPVNTNRVNFNEFSRNNDCVVPVMTNHMPCVVPASSSYISSIVPPSTGCLTSFVPPSTSDLSSFVPPSTTSFTSLVTPSTSDLSCFVTPSTSGLSSFVPPSTSGLSSFVPPSTSGLSSFVSPSTTGFTNFVPHISAGLTNTPRLPKVSTTTSSQLHSANPGIARVASCKIISPAPRKFVSILPKGPQCFINRFQQPNWKNPYQSNGRLLRNSQERQRRNETKQALQTVKNLVPRLTFAEKPSQITILNETIKYVKYLQKEEQDDLEELEAQRKTLMKLKSKCRSFF